MDPGRNPPRGRGTPSNPPNRFERLHYEPSPEDGVEESASPTEYYRDPSRSILSRNDSPDVGFEVSLNPYRGCEHGCVYCYARPTHEYLGFSSGLDFETKILVKERAPVLLRRALSLPSWRPQTIALSGVTDPYQPIERRLALTRRCLEVLCDFRNPVVIVTKNFLVTRDTDVLADLAAREAAAVCLSVTTLDPQLQRRLEPRASSPARRLEAIRRLSEAGVPVRVLVAPVIPGLTEHEIPSILRAAREAGAGWAGYILLRLPHQVKELFQDWLARHVPERKVRVLNRIREVRGGKLNEVGFHSRMRGEGEYARRIGELFQLSCRRLGLNGQPLQLSCQSFRRPGRERQRRLF